MIECNNVQFATSIGVLFGLKEKYGYTTLQETYKLLESSNVDTMMVVLGVAYNRAHRGSELNDEQFIELLEEQKIGFIKISEIFQTVVEALMFNGMTDEEIAAKKKFLASLR